MRTEQADQGNGKTALVVGATGIVGSALVDALLGRGWKVAALSSRQRNDSRVTNLGADLLNLDELTHSLQDVAPSHIYYAAWSRRDTEEENCDVNGRMVSNVLTVAGRQGALRHVALGTGLKHYLGPFELYGKGNLPETPFREDQPRLSLPNFYYVQEDELFAAAERYGFTWSVHRPHTIIGFAVGNAMNMGTTLAVYATLCRELGQPFQFPGSETQWSGVTDMTSAELLASHMLWAAGSDQGHNEAFNVVNGDIFRWRWLWPRLADYFGVEAEGYGDGPKPLEEQAAGWQASWAAVAERHGLRESQLDRVASFWHTDGDLGRDVECVTDMTKSRLAGFTEYVSTEAAFHRLFERLRAERIVP